MSFIASSNCAFSLIENKEFLDLISYVSNDRANIPTTKTLMSDLSLKYDDVKAKLKKLIEIEKFVCLTADIWTNKGKSFIGITIHFFDDELNRKSFLLAFRRMYGRHTYDVIAEMLLGVQKEFNIKRKIVTHVVTDGGSNFSKAFMIFGPCESVQHVSPSPNESESSEENGLPLETEEREPFLPAETESIEIDLKYGIYSIGCRR